MSDALLFVCSRYTDPAVSLGKYLLKKKIPAVCISYIMGEVQLGL